MKKITSHISREILKSASSEAKGYSSWMRTYLSPKEFHFIKNKNLNSMSINDLKLSIDLILEDSNLESDINLVEYLIRMNTKLEVILKIIRSGFYGNFLIRNNHKRNFLLQILSYRIGINPSLNIQNIPFLSSNFVNSDSFHIIGPVCPDYSYISTNKGRYRYTFESIGDGIGLVAKRAISNFSILNFISKDLIENGLNLKFKILIGDFEANTLGLQ